MCLHNIHFYEYISDNCQLNDPAKEVLSVFLWTDYRCSSTKSIS